MTGESRNSSGTGSGSGSVSLGQQPRRVRQRTSPTRPGFRQPSRQVSQESPQQSQLSPRQAARPAARQQASQQFEPLPLPQQSTQTSQQAARQAIQKPSRSIDAVKTTPGAAASTKKRQQVSATDSATQNASRHAGGKSSADSASSQGRQPRTKGARSGQNGLSSRQGRQPTTSPLRDLSASPRAPLAAHAASPPRKRGADAGSSTGPSGARPPTSPVLSRSSSTAVPLMKPSTQIKLHARNPADPPPPGLGAAVRPSTRPSLDLPSPMELSACPPPQPASGATLIGTPLWPSTRLPHQELSGAVSSRKLSDALKNSISANRDLSSSAASQMRFRIHTEFLLDPHDKQQHPSFQNYWTQSSSYEQWRKQNISNSAAFVRTLAINHNRQVGREHLQMQSTLLIDNTPRLPSFYNTLQSEHKEWCFIYNEESPEATSGALYGKFTMLSPIFYINDPSWRSHVRATWRYLAENYNISATESGSCHTHIQIWPPPSAILRDLKRIASSVVYFETALEATLPERKFDEFYARSNWLHSPHLAQMGYGRLESAMVIQHQCDDAGTVLSTVQTLSEPRFSWNFANFERDRFIEFRRPPACLTATEALGWAEFALVFIQASIQHGSLGQLNSFSRKTGGLQSFISQVQLAGGVDSLNKLWAGKDPDAAREPALNGDVYLLPHHYTFAQVQWLLELKEVIEEDARQCGASMPQGMADLLDEYNPEIKWVWDQVVQDMVPECPLQ